MFKPLSTLLAASLVSVSLHADTTLYVNDEGQLFTKPADDRKEYVVKDSSDEKQSITIVDQKSPDFDYGKQSHINMKFIADDDPDMWLKAGIRLQGTFQYNDDNEAYDAYLRRVRFEVAAGFNKYLSFTMDVRNDKANYEDKGEGAFNVGDAYVKIKKPFDTSLVNFKLYRAKIDVSRTETTKSAFTLYYDRPHVADEAAQYITHNRRGTNAQMYGDWNKKFHYQIAFGDGVYSGKTKDALGKTFSGDDFEQTSYFYGGKVVFSPFDGWEEKKKTETYFGEGKHFSIGAAYWKSPDINYEAGGNAYSVDHELINYEISGHYKGLFAQAEYFDFDGVVKDWTSNETGDSKGWYATGEYLFTDFHYIAPFVRYEEWKRFEDDNDYKLTSKVAGINWYMRGNTMKAGLVFQEDEYGAAIGDKTESTVKVTSQFFF